MERTSRTSVLRRIALVVALGLQARHAIAGGCGINGLTTALPNPPNRPTTTPPTRQPDHQYNSPTHDPTKPALPSTDHHHKTTLGPRIWTGKEPNGIGWVDIHDEPGQYTPYPPISDSWNKSDSR